MSSLRPDLGAPPAAYHDLLAPLATGGIDLWEIEYLHILDGDDPVLEWVGGTVLRPVIEALPPAERDGFVRAYAVRLRDAYPRRSDGRTLFPFRRLFVVAQTQVPRTLSA